MTGPAALTVAITGHRPNRMPIGEAQIARRLRLVLAALRCGTRRHRHIAVSALAEGSDRLFATAALELGYELLVLLPLARADYEATFGDAGTTPVFRDLLQRANDVIELPGTPDDSTAAYEAVGHKTADTADVLVAVWDGHGAAGRGGTPEVIEYAIRNGKPVIWIDAARRLLPRLLGSLDTYGPRTVPLATLAAEAKPLTRADAERLAHSLGGHADDS